MSNPVIVAATPTLFRYTHEKTGALGEIYTFAQADILAALPPGPLRALFARTGLTDAQIKELLLYGTNVRVSVTPIAGTAFTLAALTVGDDGLGNPQLVSSVNGT